MAALSQPAPALRVVADPAGTVWAVGITVGRRPAAIVMRRTGGAWHLVAEPRFPRAYPLVAVAFLAPGDVWASGGGLLGETAVLLHWNGRSWSRQTGPATTLPGGLAGLAPISADDIWAVGYAGFTATSTPLVLHWNGTRWTKT